jgi:osmoprotectant transport system permease protein
VLSVLIGFLIAMALAVFSHGRRWLIPVFVGTTGILYTIPSIALFLLLLPVTGRGTETAVIALSIYNLQIIYRNANSGLANVPEPTKQAGRGMGMTNRQLLWRVELPLAVPEIIAGVRIATVSTVAIATLAIFAGAGGLGEVIYNEGLQRGVFKTNILFGSAIAMAMAIGFDGLLVLSQRVVSPWRRVRTI